MRLEQEWLTELQRPKRPATRRPEVDLVDLRPIGKKGVPIAIGNADVPPHAAMMNVHVCNAEALRGIEGDSRREMSQECRR